MSCGGGRGKNRGRPRAGLPCPGASAGAGVVAFASAAVAPVMCWPKVGELPVATLGAGPHMVHGRAERVPPSQPPKDRTFCSFADPALSARWAHHPEEALPFPARRFRVWAVGTVRHDYHPRRAFEASHLRTHPTGGRSLFCVIPYGAASSSATRAAIPARDALSVSC